MKSPFCFVVTPLHNKRYDNVKRLDNSSLILSSTKEDHTVSNRFAKVVSTPINYSGPVNKDDVILVHHNVFKFYYDMKGREKSGRSFLKDDQFLIEDNQWYAYKKNHKWYSNEDYCFIKPLKKEDSVIFNNETYQPLMGTVAIGNKMLEKIGVNKGDKVCFKPNSEYEFIIDDKKLYRMRCKNITIKL